MSKKEPLEVIEQIELTKLHPFPDHPFGVRDDDSMQQTVYFVACRPFEVCNIGSVRTLCVAGSFIIVCVLKRAKGDGGSFTVTALC